MSPLVDFLLSRDNVASGFPNVPWRARGYGGPAVMQPIGTPNLHISW